MSTTKSAHQRGLGYAHRKQRENLLRQHLDGAPCWWCGQPMYRLSDSNFDRAALEADHSISRSHGGTKADRLLHMTCNRERGDGTRDSQRPALGGERPTAPGGLGNLTMPWP